MQNDPFENLKRCVLKAGHTARLDMLRPFPPKDKPHLHLESVDLKPLWPGAAVWAGHCLNHFVTAANSKTLSPPEVLFGEPPPPKLVHFLQPGKMLVVRASKSH